MTDSTRTGTPPTGVQAKLILGATKPDGSPGQRSGTPAGDMHQGFSLYLDVLRFAAAAEVFLYHLSMWVPSHWHPVAFDFGHESVIVFFVLSGYVISYTAATKDRSLRRFAINRIVRVYSISVPALLLTLLLEHWGQPHDPAIYQGFAPIASPLPRFAISLFLLNESWVSVQYFSDPVAWSLCYEVAYYAIFGSCFFLTGRNRVLALSACLLVAGPRVLLLLPIWLMGSWAYFERRSANWNRYVHWALLILPVPAFWLYLSCSLSSITMRAAHEAGWTASWQDLANSRHMLSDCYLGMALTLHFLGGKNLGPQLYAVLGRVAPVVRTCAACTFALYMIHFPVMLFTVAMFGVSRPGIQAATVVAVAAATAVVGYSVERQRYRLRRPLGLLFDATLGLVVPVAAASPGLRRD